MKLDRALSSYLDLMRFTAALAVMLGHMEQDGLFMDWLPLSWFSHEAVMVFFVMSGFIIHSSTVAGGRNWADYAAARLSRIYSVALPAVVFSVCLGAWVIASGHFDTDRLSNLRPFSVWEIFSSLFFLNEAPWNSIGLTLNGPYWSLCYEVWYYVLFGAFLFLRGRSRVLALAGAALLAGPAIMALFPIWVMGALLAARLGESGQLRQPLAWLAFFGSLAVIVAVHMSGVDNALRIYLHDHVPGYWRLMSAQRFLTDYLLGLAVVVHIAAFSGLAHGFRQAFGRIAPLTRFLAGFSFTLYLFHRPMTQLLGYAYPNTGHSYAYALGCAGLLLLACLLISYGTERRLSWWRHFFVARLQNLAQISGRP